MGNIPLLVDEYLVDATEVSLEELEKETDAMIFSGTRSGKDRRAAQDIEMLRERKKERRSGRDRRIFSNI